MTDEWIDFYMAWLSHYDTRFFYCLNYAAQPISIMGESRNLWTQRPGPVWSTRHLRLNIPLQDLVGPTRDYLETLYEKTPAKRSLKEWSIYRGHILSKTTYVEGNTVMEYMPFHPKELLWIARWLVHNGADPYVAVRELLEAELGGELYHDPPLPA